MKKIAIMLTCHNRRDKTTNCINSLISDSHSVQFIVVDDGSDDGTVEALDKKDDVTILRGDGSLFYSGGMRVAMEYAKSNIEADLYILVNDDVVFEEDLLDRVSLLPTDRVYVGAMMDSNGECSYGGVKYFSGIHYKKVTPDSNDRNCDTFNANFVVIPESIFKTVPSIDKHYVHGLGDFDYGLSIKQAGYRIEVLDFYAGICNNNSLKGTWSDRSLSRMQRFKLKESVKGAPFKPWFFFLKKNFGLKYAIIYSITPYLRILLT